MMKKKDIIYRLFSGIAITHPLSPLERGKVSICFRNKEYSSPLLRRGRGCVIFSLLLFFLASCSTTKNLPEGEVLYTGIKKIDVTHDDKTTAGEDALAEVEGALAYPPNNALLGSSSIRVPFPFGLWV